MADTTFCTYCHHTIHRMQKQLDFKPLLITKINYLKSIVNTHTTRDQDNILICPMLKSYRCSKCHEYGHTPSRCTPCEYCEERGHNDRECPKKRAHEKDLYSTIVLRLTKKVGFDDLLHDLKTFCDHHHIEIVKQV